MKRIHVALLLVAMLGLSGCFGGTKQGVGTLIGAGIGGLVGSQIGSGVGQLAAVGAGTFLGAIAGSNVGRQLDESDRRIAAQARYEVLERAPSGTGMRWGNPGNGHAGHVMPVQTFQASSGLQCREFQETVFIGGRTQQAYGTACRMPDGSWQIMSNNSPVQPNVVHRQRQVVVQQPPVVYTQPVPVVRTVVTAPSQNPVSDCYDDRSGDKTVITTSRGLDYGRLFREMNRKDGNEWGVIGDSLPRTRTVKRVQQRSGCHSAPYQRAFRPLSTEVFGFR
jgi:surface antigen